MLGGQEALVWAPSSHSDALPGMGGMRARISDRIVKEFCAGKRTIKVEYGQQGCSYYQRALSSVALCICTCHIAKKKSLPQYTLNSAHGGLDS